MASSSEGSPKGSQPPWSQLQPDLLEIIAKKAIGNISDHIQFRSVCRAWRSVADPHLVKLPPLLMLCYDPSVDDRAFFSLSSKSVLAVSLPEAQGKLILTSSHGWLVMLDPAKVRLSLFNPVTRAEIPLPPTTALAPRNLRFFPTSAFLSSEPDSANADCVVIIDRRSSRNIIFCRPRDEGWTVFHTDLAKLPHSILYRQGRFYAMDDKDMFYVYNADSDPLRPELIYTIEAPFSGNLGFLEKTTGAEFFLFVDDSKYILVGAAHSYYYRLDMSKEPPEWSPVDDIGDRALFWTAEPSVSLHSWDFSECRANCIYYSTPYDSWRRRRAHVVHQIKVFDIMTGKFEFLSCGWKESPGHVKPAMWFTPSLRKMEDASAV